MAEPGDGVVFRPSRQRFAVVWRQGLKPVGVLVGALLVIGLIAFHGHVLTVVGAFAPVLVVIGGALAFVVALDIRPKIVVSPDTITVRRLTRGRTTSRADVGTAVLTTVKDYGVSRFRNPELTGVRLYLLRRDGSRIANLAEEFWGQDQFAAITALLGVPTDEVGTLTPGELRRRYRGAVPWAAAHVISTTLLIELGLFVLIVLIAGAVALGQSVF